MDGVAPSIRGGMKLRISRSFPRLLNHYPHISQGPRSGLGEAEDEGEESVEEEEFEETEVAASLVGSPEASEAPNLAQSNQPLVSQAQQNSSRCWCR
ncbi:hypothetical protein O181_060707 [Austropuccinia psidii MF-1]|uniref:Uncharacterized protein n=1 Tax=Austropuccinia psidii MF-1 TaxID=1389203 RepID=A0A9Q3HYP3_9BASI|nr:hypothetical protein [Austropuccinia psidii MF-1]